MVSPVSPRFSEFPKYPPRVVKGPQATKAKATSEVSTLAKTLDIGVARAVRSTVVPLKVDADSSPKIMELKSAELERASVAQRATMVESLSERKGYWKGFGGALALFFVDFLCFGLIWNKKSMRFRFDRHDKKHENKIMEILLTTPDLPKPDRGLLVAKMSANGQRAKIEEAVGDRAKQFFHDAIYALPASKMAAELKYYTREDAADILRKVTAFNQDTGQAVNEVGGALLSNGGFELLVPPVFERFNGVQCTSAAEIMNPDELDRAVRTWIAKQSNAFYANEVIAALPAHRSTYKALEALMLEKADIAAIIAGYDAGECAEQAVRNTSSLAELAAILRKTGEVVGEAKKTQLMEKIAGSEAYKQLGDIAFFLPKCQTEADYAAIERQLDGFDDNFKQKRIDALRIFFADAGLQGSAIAAKLEDALVEKLEIAKDKLQDYKAQCRADIASYQFEQYESEKNRLTRLIDSLNTQVRDVTKLRDEAKAQGKDVSWYETRITELNRELDRAIQELKDLKRPS